MQIRDILHKMKRHLNLAAMTLPGWRKTDPANTEDKGSVLPCIQHILCTQHAHLYYSFNPPENLLLAPFVDEDTEAQEDHNQGHRAGK